MAAVSLFWDTNMAAVTSCENTAQIIEFYQKQPLQPETVFFFRLESSVREYRTTFSDVLVAPEYFFLERHQKQCSMYFSNGFVGKLFVF